MEPSSNLSDGLLLLTFLCSLPVLSLLAKEGSILVDDSIKLKEPKTKELIKQINGLNLEGRKRIIIVSSDENIYKSANNIPNIAAIKLNSLCQVVFLLPHSPFHHPSQSNSPTQTKKTLI